LNKVIFSQSGVYRLQQLASRFHHITGIRHKLSDEAAMLDLLRNSAKSDHKIRQTYFAAFAKGLNEEQANKLRAKGIQPQISNTH